MLVNDSNTANNMPCFDWGFVRAAWISPTHQWARCTRHHSTSHNGNRHGNGTANEEILTARRDGGHETLQTHNHK